MPDATDPSTTPVAPTTIVPDPNDPGVIADVKREEFLAMLEGMDVVQALRFHSIIMAIPFGYRAPVWLDWTKHIIPSATPDAVKLADRWDYVNSTPNPVTERVSPYAVAMLLVVGNHNSEGISTRYPWITPNDIAATAVWARATNMWPKFLLNHWTSASQGGP